MIISLPIETLEMRLIHCVKDCINITLYTVVCVFTPWSIFYHFFTFYRLVQYNKITVQYYSEAQDDLMWTVLSIKAYNDQ